MFKQFRILFILLLIFIVPFQVFSQSISISTTPTLQNAQVMYFSNFDIFAVGNPLYLFDVTVTGLDPGNDNDTYIKLVFLHNSKEVATATSNIFKTESNATASYSASNIQLINSYQLGGFDINNFSSTFDPPDDNFENELYGSGKARSGEYKLRVELYINNSLADDAQVALNISNPSNIQLSDPGNKAGSGAPQEIMNEFPVFSFFSDGDEYVLSIYEKLSHHNSIEDVINSGNPIYKTDPSMPLTSPILNYATANGQPLQIGSTYYWFVDVLVPTTAGIETFRSEVYQFKVASLGGNSGQGQAVTSVIEMLRPVVGNEADNLSKNLTNFELKTIKINGKTISIYELQQIIESYEGHLLEISELALY